MTVRGAAPLVSILVPTIGRLEYLKDTIASVREQTLRDFEVLVLDNASPPTAARALENWAASDERIQILRAESRVPMFANFNRGIASARGAFVTFFHDDDIYLPRFLECATSGLTQNPSAAIAGSNHDFIDNDGRLTEVRRWIRATRVMPGREYMERLMRRGRNIVAMPGLVFKREAVLGGFDNALSIHFGDFVWLMRIAEQHDLFLSSENLMRVRRHAARASQGLPFSRGISQRTQVLLDYCDEYLTRHPEEDLLVTRLRRRVRVLHRVGLTWGWATAPSVQEATACVEGLGDGLSDITLRALMRTVDRTPVRTALQGPAWRNVARRIGTALGV